MTVDIIDINSLFKTRVLDSQEVFDITSQLSKEQNSMKSINLTIDTFNKRFNPNIIKNILLEHGIETIYQLSTSKNNPVNYQINIARYDTLLIEYAENTNWTSSEMNWSISTNYCGDITIFGKWLIDELYKFSTLKKIHD